MKYKDLFELRKNPEQNPKIAGHAQAVQYLLNVPDDIDNYGISMTNLPKLGINPRSTHDSTPLGIYFYPSRYYLKIMHNDEKLPYQHDAKYINIVKFGGDGVMNMSKTATPSIDQTIDIIGNYLANALGMSDESEIEKLKLRLLNGSGRSAFNDRIYDIVKYASDILSTSKRAEQKNALQLLRNRVIVWNKMLREIGWKVAIDLGTSTIHSYEPTQGVILDPTAIIGHKAFQNTNPIDMDSFSKSNDIYRGDINKMYKVCTDSGKRNAVLERKLLDVLAGENSIISFMYIDYARYAIKGPWPEFEKMIPGILRKGSADEAPDAYIDNFEKIVDYVYRVYNGAKPSADLLVAMDQTDKILTDKYTLTSSDLRDSDSYGFMVHGVHNLYKRMLRKIGEHNSTE